MPIAAKLCYQRIIIRGKWKRALFFSRCSGSSCFVELSPRFSLTFRNNTHTQTHICIFVAPSQDVHFILFVYMCCLPLLLGVDIATSTHLDPPVPRAP